MPDPLIDIRPDHWAIVADILRRHVPDREVWAFGSRAKWTARDTSDLDLCIVGETPLGFKLLGRLRDAFSESNLPYKVDVVDWATTSESFREIIERDKVVVQEGKRTESGMGGEWREMPFSEAVALNPAVRLKRGSEYPFVDMQAVNTGSRCAYPSERRSFGAGGSRFAAGDTLMARITPCLENGKIAQFCADDGAVAHGSTEFIVIRGRHGITDTNYAYYLTKWEGVSGYAISQMTGTSGRQRVPTESLDHLLAPVPPLPDQRAIAHILGTLDDKIELNRRMNETLEAMARALFKSWFVDFDPVRAKQSKNVGWVSPSGRNPPDNADGGLRGYAANPPYELARHILDLFPAHLVDSALGEIPEGWEVRTLDELLELAYGKALKAESRRDGDVPVYGSNGQVGWHDERLARGPGIVVGRKGNPGVVTWAPTDFFVIDTAFFVVPKDVCSSLHFLFHVLQSHDLASLGADSAVPGLNRNLAYMSAQLLPSMQLREKFDAVAGVLAARAHACSQESCSLAALRDTLLPRLISGELRVKDAEKFICQAAV